MKITIVMSALDSGGAERILTTLANAWSERGIKIHLLTYQEPTYKPFYSLHPGITLCNLNLLNNNKNLVVRLCDMFRRLSVLRQNFKKQKPELIVAFIDITNITTLIAAIGLQIPVIVSERTDPHHYNIGFFNALLRKITYPWAKHIVVQTSHSLSYFPITLQNQISVIPNPVAIPPQNSYDKIDFSKKQIVAAGRLSKEKGFDLLLLAFAEIHAKFPEWKLVIWGEGAEGDSLKRLCVSLDLESHVSFPGVTQNIYAALAQGSIFVLPSRLEGFPNALCEAMAIGLAVVAFNCRSGPSDIVRDQIDGLLVPPENVAALGNAMEQLMGNIELRQQLGNRAAEIVQRFPIERIMKEWDRIISQ